MTKSEARNLAIELMSKHNLSHWRFEFNTRKRALGICKHGLNVIGLSSYLLPSMSTDIVRNTILHEIAHALVGRGHGHDYVWRAKALEIGCDGERCASIELEENTLAKYSAQCSECGYVHNRHRRPKRESSCNCIGYFDPNRTLTFVQNY